MNNNRALAFSLALRRGWLKDRNQDTREEHCPSFQHTVLPRFHFNAAAFCDRHARLCQCAARASLRIFFSREIPRWAHDDEKEYLRGAADRCDLPVRRRPPCFGSASKLPQQELRRVGAQPIKLPILFHKTLGLLGCACVKPS